MIKTLLLAALYILVADEAFAGPAIAAISLAAQSFMGWATATALGTSLLNTAIGMGLTAIARAVWEPDQPKQAGITKEYTTRGETTKQSFIVGRYATEGHMNGPAMTYQTDDDPNEWLVYVWELSDLPITGYGRIFIDGEAAEFKSAPNDPATVISQTNMGATVEGEYENKVFVRLHMGNQTAADRYLVEHFSDYPERPWSTAMMLKGVAYAVVTFKGRPKDGVYTGGFPSLRIELDGAPMFDPRTGTTVFTTNPMVIGYNIVRGFTLASGQKWGYNASASDIITSRAVAAMNACDEAVNIAGGGTEPRYRAGLEIKVDSQPADVLQVFMDACHGNFADMGGEIILSAGPPAPSVYSFTDADLISTSDEDFEPFPGQDEIKNGAHAKYPSPDNWETREAHPYYNADFELVDGQRLVAEFSFAAVPYPRQVRRLMREMVKDGRRYRIHLITLPPDAGGVMLLDTVTWTSNHNGYTTKLFEVVQKTIDPYTDCVTLQIRERDPSDYNPDMFLDDDLPIVVNPRPVRRPPPRVHLFGVEAITVTGAAGQVRPAFRLSWNPETAGQAIAWQVVLRDDKTKLVNANSTTDVDAGSTVIQSGILANTWYSIRPKIVYPNRKSNYEPWIDILSLSMSLGDDLLDVIMDDIRLQIGDIDAWFGEQGADIRAIFDEINDIKDRIVETDFGSYSHTEEVRTSLQLALDDAEARFEERLIVAVGDGISASQLIQQIQADVANNSARITAEATARANADSAMTLRIGTAESVLGRGDNVISDQYLKTVAAPGWNRWNTGGTLTRAPSPMYALGTAWTFGITDVAQQTGLQINSQNETTWPGPVDADAYVVEIEYSLLSGTLAGAGVQVAWFNSAGTSFSVNMRLDAMVAGSTMFNRASTARGLFKRPAGIAKGVATWNRVIVFANYPFGAIAPGGVKNIRFDRVRIRTATKEELGQGAVLDEINARIGDLDFTDVDKDGSYTLRIEELESNWISAEGTLEAHATALDNRYTKTETNSAISGRIQSWASTFTDGENTGIANVINAVRSRVTKTEAGIESHSQQLVEVRSRTNRTSATGRLRVTTEATPTGALSRIGLRAEANADEETQSAALFLEAKTGGLSTVGVMADRFFVASASGPAATRTIPFIIQGGVVYIDAAKISNVIQSTNFVAGENGTGWRILRTGAAEFNNVTIRRQLSVANGSLAVSGMALSASNSISSNNGPAYVRMAVTTIPMSAWSGIKDTYLAVAGISGATGTSSNATGDELWGWTATVAPLTKWSGTQQLRIIFEFWHQGLSSMSAHTINWRMYKVS